MFESRRGYQASRGQLWWWAAATAIVAGMSLVRCLAAARLGLGDVEAYYWTWSRHLAPGYLDHGPVVALLIRLGGLLVGSHSTVGVRAPFVLVSAATALGCAALGARLCNRGSAPAAALWAVVALVCMPAFLVAGGAANPDVPLAGLAVALLAVLLALPGSARPLRWLTLGGLLVGLAVCTKLLGLALLAPLLLEAARLRRRLVAVSLALGAALLGALPVLIWNAQHGWASLRYHLLLRHSQPAGPSLANLGKLVGGQLAYVSPFLLGGLLAVMVALWRERGLSPDRRVLLECALPSLLAGYFLIALVPSAEPHWPLPGYLPLLVALAARMPDVWRRPRLRGLASAALVLAALLGLGLHLHLLTDLGVRVMPASYVPALDLSNELHGWPQVAAAVRARRRPGEPVAGCHYTVCAQLAFASRGAFPVLCPSARLDQFDFAPGGDGSSFRGDLLYVLDPRFPFPAQKLYRCRSVEELDTVRVLRGGRLVRSFRLQRCQAFQGLRGLRWPPTPPPEPGELT